MNIGTLALLELNLALIGLLPHIFFRADGKLNVKWWMTAAPYFLAAAVLLLTYLGIIKPVAGASAMAQMACEAIAAALSAGSIGLIAYTLGTHRRRLSLWHQDNDAPEEIVTYGAYKYVRHPFYASFLLCLAATLAASPSIWSLGLFAYGLFSLNYTASIEENKLANSALGEKYRAYLQQSGRFIPKFNRAA